jgi:acetoin utilization protein AcuB
MFVRERMTRNVITVAPDVSVTEAMSLMRAKKIRRLPVIDQAGKLAGIVSEQDLLYASPSPATSLSIWEMNYLLAKLKVRDVMTSKVITVSEDTPLEEAAATMADNKIGGLPVTSGDKIVGIITETDLFKVFTSLLGARRAGVRVTAMISETKGTLAKITSAVSAAGGDIVAFSEYQDDNNQWYLALKVSDIPQDKLVTILEDVVEKIVDVRDSPAIEPK